MSSQVVIEPQPTPSPQKAPSAAPTLTYMPTPARALFSQSLVELSGTDRKRKQWTQLFSFVIQAIIAIILIIIPLWFTDALPVQQLSTFLVAPPPPPPPPPPAAPTLKISKVVSQVVNGQLLAPSKIPQTIKMIKEEEAPPQVSGGVIGGVEGGVPGGQAGGVIGSLLSSTAKSSGPPPAIAVPKRLRISSGITEGMLMKRVEPLYPPIAERARVQGTVQLKAIISKEGSIENLQLVSGHPLLVPAAMDAVKQWRYRPYILNGEPLEVETIVVVNFHLN